MCRLAAGTLLSCAAAAAPGCFGGGREPAVLGSNDPASKIPAIKKAAGDGSPERPRDTQTAQHLVKSLDSEDPAVRFYAIRGLQSLTGETFGYVWYADERQRRDATGKWQQWLGQPEPGTLAGGNGRER